MSVFTSIFTSRNYSAEHFKWETRNHLEYSLVCVDTNTIALSWNDAHNVFILKYMSN